MSYKSLTYLSPSASHTVTALKDFMVSCGWTLVGPSSDSEIANQDDPNGFMLGWFLHSSGEDGKQDIHAHLGLSPAVYASGLPAFMGCTYLTSSISSSAQTIPVSYGALVAAGSYVRIDNELIMVGGVSGNSWTGCARGVGQSAAAAHSTGAVAQDQTGAYPVAEVYAARDFTHPIAQSSSGPITIDSTGGALLGSISTVSGLGGYGNDGLSGAGGSDRGRFAAYTSLVKTVSTNPAVDGKYRWIATYTDNTTSGSFTMQPFKDATMSADSIQLFPGGFLPAWSRRRTTSSGTYFRSQIGAMRYTYAVAGVSTWFYGSKNAVIVISKNSSYYDVFYFGNVIPFSTPSSALTTSAAAVGASSLVVDNAYLFVAGQKLRVIGMSGYDWADNKDVTTQNGASSWPKLDAEEMPTEEVVISSINYDTKTLYLSGTTTFSYRAGALVGEDPRPAVRQSCNAFTDDIVGDWFPPGLWPCYLPCDKTVLTSHASQRQTYRAFHSTGDRKIPGQADTNDSMAAARLTLTYPGVYTYAQTNNRNLQNNTLPLVTLCALQNNDSREVNKATWGIFLTMKGSLHGAFYSMQAPPFVSATSGDTAYIPWGGEWKLFRLFYVGRTNQAWCAFGPEE